MMTFGGGFKSCSSRRRSWSLLRRKQPPPPSISPFVIGAFFDAFFPLHVVAVHVRIICGADALSGVVCTSHTHTQSGTRHTHGKVGKACNCVFHSQSILNFAVPKSRTGDTSFFILRLFLRLVDFDTDTDT